MLSGILFRALEAYLTEELQRKFGNELGTSREFKVSIEETIGTESLQSFRDFTPNLFADATKKIALSWENDSGAPIRLKIGIYFHNDGIGSRLYVECTALAAREVGLGVRGAVFRILEPHRTNNWFFNSPTPGGMVTRALLSSLGLYGVLASILFPSRRAPWVAASSLVLWYMISGYLKAYVTFDSRWQKSADAVWKYVSMGALGFVLFGTVFPQLRKILLGF